MRDPIVGKSFTTRHEGRVIVHETRRVVGRTAAGGVVYVIRTKGGGTKPGRLTCTLRDWVSWVTPLPPGRRIRHGHAKARTTEYGIWHGIIRRCEDSAEQGFKNYGGRGITVCERWRHSFEAFLIDVGMRPSKLHSIERIDNDGNYEPGNVRWATMAQQRRNSRQNRFITVGARRMILTDWAREIGISSQSLSTRFKRGWTLQEAVSTPKRGRR